MHAAIAALKKEPGVKDAPILLAGESRGGALSIAYAGRYPQTVAGVVNFVGGWLSENCGDSAATNQALLARAPAFPGATLWIYGNDDAYYSLKHSRANFSAFEKAGGTGSFVEVRVSGTNNSHFAMIIPTLWQDALSAYLDEIKSPRR